MHAVAVHYVEAAATDADPITLALNRLDVN